MARPTCLLLVDSDPERQHLVRRAMRRRGDLVLTAASAAEALSRLEQCAIPIDWVVIDTSADDAAGARSLAAEIAARNSQIGILLSVESPFDCEYRLLLKPYAARDLYATLG